PAAARPATSSSGTSTSDTITFVAHPDGQTDDPERPLAPMFLLQDTRSTLTRLSFSLDGRLLAAGGYRGVLQVWDLTTRCLLRKKRWPSEIGIGALFLSADGSELVALASGSLLALGVASGELVDRRPSRDAWTYVSLCQPSPDRKNVLLFLRQAGYEWHFRL